MTNQHTIQIVISKRWQEKRVVDHNFNDEKTDAKPRIFLAKKMHTMHYNTSN